MKAVAATATPDNRLAERLSSRHQEVPSTRDRPCQSCPLPVRVAFQLFPFPMRQVRRSCRSFPHRAPPGPPSASPQRGSPVAWPHPHPTCAFPPPCLRPPSSRAPNPLLIPGFGLSPPPIRSRAPGATIVNPFRSVRCGQNRGPTPTAGERPCHLPRGHSAPLGAPLPLAQATCLSCGCSAPSCPNTFLVFTYLHILV